MSHSSALDATLWWLGEDGTMPAARDVSVPMPLQAMERLVDQPFYMVTAENKRRFLEYLAASGTIRRACYDMDISRQAVWRWRQEDPAFARAVQEVLDVAHEARREQLEEVLDDLAINDKHVLALFFRLKKLDPSYRDNYQPPQTVTIRQNQLESLSEQELTIRLRERLIKAAQALPAIPQDASSME